MGITSRVKDDIGVDFKVVEDVTNNQIWMEVISPKKIVYPRNVLKLPRDVAPEEAGNPGYKDSQVFAPLLL